MKNLMKKTGKSSFKQAFTLVELIVVIAIVAILAVSAGMMLTKWIGKAKDTRVVADLNTIEKTMEVQYVYNANYPIPDEDTTITGTSGETLWKQGTFGETVVSSIDELTKVPQDESKDNPLEGYDYSVTKDQQNYEVYGKLSDGTSISYNPYLNQTIAEEQDTYITSVGNYQGYIIGTTGTTYNMYNAPSMYLLSGTQLISGTNQVYSKGETIDTEKEVKNIDISNLYDTDSSNDEVTLQEIASGFNITEQEAKLAVNNARGESVSVYTSTTSSEDTTPSGPPTPPTEGTCDNGLCVFNLSDGTSSTDKKLMTYQPANVDLPDITTYQTTDGVPTDLEWGCYGSGTSATDNENGSGNTQTIVEQGCTIYGGGDSGPDYIAADYCDALEITVDGYTYDDWYLPAQYELHAMCSVNSSGTYGCNSGSLDIGGDLGVGFLWSSTESNAFDARYLDSSGYLGDSTRTQNWPVQCVRSAK